MSDQNVILNDGNPEAEAGVDKEDDHEDVVEDSVPIIVGTAEQHTPKHNLTLQEAL